MPVVPLLNGFATPLPPALTAGESFLAALEAVESSGPAPGEAPEPPRASPAKLDHIGAPAAPPVKAKKAPPEEPAAPLWSVPVPAPVREAPPPATAAPGETVAPAAPPPDSEVPGTEAVPAAGIAAESVPAAAGSTMTGRPFREALGPSPRMGASAAPREDDAAKPAAVPAPRQRQDPAQPADTPVGQSEDTRATIAPEIQLPAAAPVREAKKIEIPATRPFPERHAMRGSTSAEDRRERRTRTAEPPRERTDMTPREDVERLGITVADADRPEVAPERWKPASVLEATTIDEMTQAPSPEAPRDAETHTSKARLAFGGRLTSAESTPERAVAAGARTSEDGMDGEEEAPEPPPKTRNYRPAGDVAQPQQGEHDAATAAQQLSPRAPGPRAEPEAEKAPEAARGQRAAELDEKPITPPVARDIRVEVAGGEQKVELRLVERAGQVQFAVRTTDNGLAGSLREHLPSLSARLEQSGFHTDHWHVAEAGGERRLDVSSSTESSWRGADQESRGREQSDERRQQQQQPHADRRQSQQKGRPFEWLMQSLR